MVRRLWQAQRNDLSVPEFRRRLSEARLSTGYREPFEAILPRVTVIIPTHTAPSELWEVAIPSALSQADVEVDIVIPIRVENADAIAVVKREIARHGGRRIRLLKVKGVKPLLLNAEQRWLASGTIEFVAGLRSSRGHWIAPFAHDDELVDGALARLVHECQRRELELCYGDIAQIAGGEIRHIHCSDPPRLHEFGFQGSVWHRSLKMFEHRESDALRYVPNDWGTMQRMLSADVRIGHLHEVTCRYFPSRLTEA